MGLQREARGGAMNVSVALSELVFLSFVTASVKPIVGLVRILGGGYEGLSLE